MQSGNSSQQAAPRLWRRTPAKVTYWPRDATQSRSAPTRGTMKAVLAGCAERAEDLKRSLISFDGAPLLVQDMAPVLSQYQHLSQQVSLLGKRRADGQALLERHYVVPASVAEHPEAIPHLLGSRLELELIDEKAASLRTAEDADAKRVASGEPAASAQTLEQHNATVNAALDYLSSTAKRLDLPGAFDRRHEQSQQQTAHLAGAGSSSGGRAAAGPAAAGEPPAGGIGDAARTAAAARLLSALRTGQGLEPPVGPGT